MLNRHADVRKQKQTKVNTLDITDSSPYKKKSHTASISKSNRRADHKHQYEPVIIKWLFGFRWGRICSTCGRVDDGGTLSTARRQDFLKPEAKQRPGISNRDFLSIHEVRLKFPGVDIFEIGKRVQHGKWEYIMLLDDGETEETT